MGLGIIIAYDNVLRSGEVTDIEGHILVFHFQDGQNMEFGDDLITPQLTGRHKQPDGYGLKTPAVGDPIIFNFTDKVESWGYARHFVELAERQYGTLFAT
jgi:hypothetical protein